MNPHFNHLITQFVLAFLLTLACVNPALAVEPSCYSAEVPAPLITEQTIVLLDLTAPLEGNPVRDFVAAVTAVARRPGQRIVILPFAGIAHGETVSRALDEVIEAPITDDDVINNARIGPFKRSQKCVHGNHMKIQAKIQAVLATLLKQPEQPMAKSEIVYTLRRSIADFAQRDLVTRMLVYSDALQNGSGMNFYLNGQPRDIDPATELRKLARTKQDQLETDPGVFRAYWWGLLGETGSSATKIHYRDAQTLEHYAGFWRQLLTGWKAQSVDIGPTLNNPNLRLSSHP